jgi:hypothetical protein
MPQDILTNIASDHPPSFFSLKLLKELANPDNPGQLENLYKLVTREEVPLADIEQYLEHPEITWIDRQPLPQSVPVLKDDGDKCRSFLEKIEILPGLYYAGGGEQVVASAEFGCRMGANAADLVLDAAINQQ